MSLSISISISIFSKTSLSISISIFSKISLSISISISIFSKSVDISTIDIRYRYIEQGYSLRGRNQKASLKYPFKAFRVINLQICWVVNQFKLFTKFLRKDGRSRISQCWRAFCEMTYKI